MLDTTETADPVQGPPPGELEAVLAHHRTSSLDPGRGGNLPERLERRSRPNPFRRYLGAPRFFLPLGSEPVEVCEHGRRIGRIFEDSLALAGWKRVENAGFGLRRVPSAGNLHALEAYVVGPALEADVGAGTDSAVVYHYSAFDHALERRRRLPEALWTSLKAVSPEAVCFFALSTIYWRTAWKYGERSFRLCHLDAGHAVAAVDAAAALSDQRVRWVDAADVDLARLSGLPGSGPEAEDAVCLLALEPRRAAAVALRWRPGGELLGQLDAAGLEGEPSPVSACHRSWPGIPPITRMTRRHRSPSRPVAVPVPGDQTAPAWSRQVLHRRRSRSTFSDRPLETAVLLDLVGRLTDPVGSSFPWRGDLAVLLFVHRVEGLDCGLYAAVDRSHIGLGKALSSALREDFEWLEQPVGRGLFRLTGGDARAAAIHLAGDQQAAGSGAFTALVLARLGPSLEQDGPFAYRRLHWQAGELGHRLYLDGEAQGLGVTGLGGFYDDRLSGLLGLEDDSWRPVYLLAVGRRAGDELELEPAYAHRLLGAEPVPAFDGGYRIPSSAR